ncbi:AtpZ/AtpI family protein [Myxococcus stipitatus]|uniref:AtpZ/AtpI family protein n=1 Tax=Myxococcus stipitatus TaxID=83455 RepID=UPI0030CB25C1
MAERSPPLRSEQARERARRDLSRFERREPAGQFWRSLSLIGSVGWPIVLLAVGGALLGWHLDTWLGTGIRLTLVLLTVGVVSGCLLAFRAVRGSGT